MPFRKWRASKEGAEVATAEVVEIVEIEAAVAEEVVAVKPKPQLGDSSAIGAPSTLTCQPESGRGARCISAGGRGLISATNPPPVRGRTCSPPNLQTNEELTSSVNVNLTKNY